MAGEILGSESDLTQQQLAAIRMAESLSKRLISDFPEIADAYRQGLHQGEIVEQFGIDRIAETRRIARQAVIYALKTLIPDEAEREELGRRNMVDNGKRAHLDNTGIHGMTYEQRREVGERVGNRLVQLKLGVHGLSKEERIAIGKANHENGIGVHALTQEQRMEIGKRVYGEKKGIGGFTSEDHKRNGEKARDMGVGIHAITPEERSARAKRTIAEGRGLGSLTPEQRKVAGKKAHSEQKGIHGLSTSERSELGRKSFESKKGIHGLPTEVRRDIAKEAVKARGFVPWESDEHEYCVLLMEDPAFQRLTRKKTCIDFAKIAAELNILFHNGENVRTKKSVINFKYQTANKRK